MSKHSDPSTEKRSSLLILRVKRAKIPSWRKIHKSGRKGNGNDHALGIGDEENVEVGAQGGGGRVHIRSIDIRPFSGPQACQQGLHRSDSFRRSERTMPRARHEGAPQEFSVSLFIYGLLVGALVLNHYEAVARRVKGEHRNLDFAVENDVPLQVIH